MKIALWVLGAVAVLALAFVIGFKIWVSTWQTYRNDKYHFTIRYPKGWVYKNWENPDVVVLSSSWNVSYQDPGLPESPGFLIVYVRGTSVDSVEAEKNRIIEISSGKSGIRYLNEKSARLWYLGDDFGGLPTEYLFYSDSENVFRIVGAESGKYFSFRKAFHYLIVREMVDSVKFEKK